ncbi:ubiquitin-conjugating enzyme E2 B isoform X3 [Tamandua tetradactyla]|uniref:ubiquitin-conjugating enzyme E2 B isoform X3 n=1 Tax=Tamandua tetradactyla TaxID=48850 RepID=UPI00405469E9
MGAVPIAGLPERALSTLPSLPFFPTPRSVVLAEGGGIWRRRRETSLQGCLSASAAALVTHSNSGGAPGVGGLRGTLFSQTDRGAAGEACRPRPGGGSCGISSDCKRTHLWVSVAHHLKTTSCSGMQLYLDQKGHPLKMVSHSHYVFYIKRVFLSRKY